MNVHYRIIIYKCTHRQNLNKIKVIKVHSLFLVREGLKILNYSSLFVKIDIGDAMAIHGCDVLSDFISLCNFQDN